MGYRYDIRPRSLTDCIQVPGRRARALSRAEVPANWPLVFVVCASAGAVAAACLQSLLL